MKRSLKKLTVLLFSGICTAQIILAPVMAQSLEDTSYLWDAFAADGVTSVEDTATPRARGDILNRGYVRLSNSDGEAGIYGETLCNHVLEEVGVELYLEKYNGSTFNSYQDWSLVEYNSYEAINTFIYPVEKGYYYRLRGYHYAIDEDLFEAVSTMTDGLPIK